MTGRRAEVGNRNTNTRRRGLGVVVALVAVVAMVSTACQQPPSPSIADRGGGCNVGIVGDSLAVGSLPFWHGAFNGRGCNVSFVNARAGRPTLEGVELIENLARLGWLPNVLVVALGTNDSIDPRRFGPMVQRVMAAAGDRPVVWVNIDKPWVEQTLNWTLRVARELHPNLHIYDWNGVTDRIPQLRLPDKIHLTEGGYRIRAELIARHVTNR